VLFSARTQKSTIVLFLPLEESRHESPNPQISCRHAAGVLA
jgi:hypothetical protein